ncbi:hypothetical protein Neosp_012670 [[Neocosmospora] mangrovei]
MFNANIHLPPAALLLFIRGVAAAEDSAEFTMNLFTDIAPILALFGEQFAQQYLSQSFTWFDHLIFACVPLGIITALSGAIRTRGPRLARSFIGRARENLATVEIGLMSSVSDEVCEMFNGSGVIRTMGRSTLAQIMIFPDEYDAAQSGASNDPSCGIHSLQTALQSKTRGGPLMVCSSEFTLVPFQRATGELTGILSEYQGKTYRRIRRLLNPNNLALKYPYNQMPEQFDFKCPPNLQLNLSTGQSSRSGKTAELLSASITAVALQLSLLAIAAVMAYHGRTSKAIGYENNIYAFPCYAAGSAFLCAGMAICSAAIESSTDEFVWTPWAKKYTSKAGGNWKPSRDPCIMWIQQLQSVGDQTFDAYAILGGSKPYVLTSSRSKDLWTTETSRKKSGNASQNRRRWWEAVTMTGVLLGSLGFIVQFIGLRGLPWPVAVSQLLAILIMALVRALIRRRVGVIPLACAALPGYELDFLASEIVFQPKFREFQDDAPFNGDWRGKLLSELVKVRERLGDLCKFKTGVSETAVALAQLIEHFMSIFFETETPGLPKKIQWATKTSAFRDDEDDAVDETTVLIEKNNGKWVVELGKLEAILSLWMASIKAWELDTEEKCDATDKRSDTKIGDWRRSGGAKVRFDRVVGDGWFYARNDSFTRDISWVRYTRHRRSLGIRLTHSSTATLPSIMAQHLFTSFMWTISEYLPKSSLHQGESNSRNFVTVDPALPLDSTNFLAKWQKLHLSHSLLGSVVKEAESAGLGTATDILLCMIPALSFRDLLPNEVVLELIPPISEGLRQHEWQEMVKLHEQLLVTCSSHEDEHFAMMALVKTIEFILLASQSDDLMNADEQGKPDIFGWTPLHYVAATTDQGHPELIDEFVRIGRVKDLFSSLDKSKRSPFHVAASSGNARFLKKCIGRADANTLQDTLLAGGLDGKTPLHLAVEGKHQDCVELLLKHSVPCQGDIWGRTPMHLAAIGWSYEIGKKVLAYFPEPLQVDKFGNTPLAYLVRNESDPAVDKGRTELARELMTAWTTTKVDDGSGNSLLHYAAAFSDEDMIETLAKELANADKPNRQGQTPLHLASREGRTAAARKLISLGAQVGSLDHKGWNVLHHAAGSQGAEINLVSSILKLEKGIINTRTTEDSRRTPLHIAAAAGNVSVATFLVSEGAELSARDEARNTPLRLALTNDRRDMIEGLLSCDGALDTCILIGQDGFEHIDLAVRRCNTDCLGTVLLHATTTMSMRIYGLKAMVARRPWKSDDSELFDLVLKSIPQQHLSILDLDVLVRVFPTSTSSKVLDQIWNSVCRDLEWLREDPWALHFFAKHGDTATLMQLLEAGADASRMDEDNWMPSNMADRHGQIGAGDLLREHQAKGEVEPRDKHVFRVPVSFRDIYWDPDIITTGDREEEGWSEYGEKPQTIVRR